MSKLKQVAFLASIGIIFSSCIGKDTLTQGFSNNFRNGETAPEHSPPQTTVENFTFPHPVATQELLTWRNFFSSEIVKSIESRYWGEGNYVVIPDIGFTLESPFIVQDQPLLRNGYDVTYVDSTPGVLTRFMHSKVEIEWPLLVHNYGEQSSLIHTNLLNGSEVLIISNGEVKLFRVKSKETYGLFSERGNLVYIRLDVESEEYGKRFTDAELFVHKYGSQEGIPKKVGSYPDASLQICAFNGMDQSGMRTFYELEEVDMDILGY